MQLCGFTISMINKRIVVSLKTADAETKDAKFRGYQKGRFSFNVRELTKCGLWNTIPMLFFLKLSSWCDDNWLSSLSNNLILRLLKL